MKRNKNNEQKKNIIPAEANYVFPNLIRLSIYYLFTNNRFIVVSLIIVLCGSNSAFNSTLLIAYKFILFF